MFSALSVASWWYPRHVETIIGSFENEAPTILIDDHPIIITPHWNRCALNPWKNLRHAWKGIRFETTSQRMTLLDKPMWLKPSGKAVGPEIHTVWLLLTPSSESAGKSALTFSALSCSMEISSRWYRWKGNTPILTIIKFERKTGILESTERNQRFYGELIVGYHRHLSWSTNSRQFLGFHLGVFGCFRPTHG